MYAMYVERKLIKQVLCFENSMVIKNFFLQASKQDKRLTYIVLIPNGCLFFIFIFYRSISFDEGSLKNKVNHDNRQFFI